MVINNTMTMSITRSPSKFAQASFYYGAASSYTVECLVLAVGVAKKTTRRPNKLAPTFVLRVLLFPGYPLPAFSVQNRISFWSTTTFCFIVVGMAKKTAWRLNKLAPTFVLRVTPYSHHPSTS